MVPQVLSSTFSAAVSYLPFGKKYTFHHLEPLCTLITLSILSKKPAGTKLTFHEHSIRCIDPGNLQGTLRLMNGDHHNDVECLKKPINQACEWWGTDYPELKVFFKDAADGMAKLEETYTKLEAAYPHKGYKDAIKGCIEYIGTLNKVVAVYDAQEKDKASTFFRSAKKKLSELTAPEELKAHPFTEEEGLIIKTIEYFSKRDEKIQQDEASYYKNRHLIIDDLGVRCKNLWDEELRKSILTVYNLGFINSVESILENLDRKYDKILIETRNK